jgi:hypothetical protein
VIIPSFFFTPELVEQIQATDGQEFASHIYSHFYCGEEGVSVVQFAVDLDVQIESLPNTRSNQAVWYLREIKSLPPIWRLYLIMGLILIEVIRIISSIEKGSLIDRIMARCCGWRNYQTLIYL